MKNVRKHGTAGIGMLVVILILCNLACLTVMCSRVIGYTQAKFVNVMPIDQQTVIGAEPPAGTDSSAEADPSRADSSAESSVEAPIVNPAPGDASSESSDEPSSGGQTMQAHPEFHMEHDVEIFKFSYDETGKITVVGMEGNEDHLIAPGTSNLYQFTLANTGDVALDYTLTMEAYVTGTDLWIPVNARVWDYTNKYLVGSAEEMPDVMELNTVDEKGVLGAGKYAVYNLEWEWPFEREDENGEIAANDQYDTMLGNLAVDEELVLHIVIRTTAEYDEDPDHQGGLDKPPQTGDDAPIVILCVLFGASFVGICAMGIVLILSKRKKDHAEQK
ncbi:MAG: hypothetical protein J1E00_02990 [Oscillospiraceae bacterium]|nr:hypothetical protein [Oscillospiraceae bacterium]